MTVGWTLNAANNKELLESKFTYLVAENLLMIPVVSDVMKWCGGAKASREIILSRMKNEDNIAVIPGGFEEATVYEYEKNVVYIMKRKGFIKYAL